MEEKTIDPHYVEFMENELNKAWSEKHELKVKIDQLSQPFLKACSTKALCDELISRKAVEHIYLGPYDNGNLKLDGPSLIIIVTD